MASGERQFGYLRKLPSGRWQAAVNGGTVCDPATGKPRRQRYPAPTTYSRKADAQAWLTAQRQAIERGDWVPPKERAKQLAAEARSREMLRDYSDRWLATRMRNGKPLAPRTRAHYRRLLDRSILPTLGKTPVAELDAEQVKRWHAKLLPTAATERAHTYSLLRTIMSSAVTDGIAKANPCTIPSAGKVTRASVTVPATAQELAATTTEMGPEMGMTATLGAWCALRAGEVLGLQRCDLRVQEIGPAPIAPVVKLLVRRQYLHSGGLQNTTKTAAGTRSVTVPPHIVKSVFLHLHAYVADDPAAWFFPSPTVPGQPISRTTLFKQYFYPAREAACRPDLRFHDLRHTGAVLAAQAGATIRELQDRLGHATPGAAMRYQHVAAGRDAEIAARMSQLAGS